MPLVVPLVVVAEVPLVVVVAEVPGALDRVNARAGVPAVGGGVGAMTSSSSSSPENNRSSAVRMGSSNARPASLLKESQPSSH